jgi:peptidoglycan/LPS O-acetylase OafA/YrhL
LENLDVLRAIAALAVCLFHFRRAGHWEEMNRLMDWGYLGVEVFFVISGFVIPLALANSRFTITRAPRFLLSRFMRLYPAYAVAALAALGLWYASSMVPGFAGSDPQWDPGVLAANAFLICDFVGQPWIIPVFWSLAIEAQYYLLVCLCFPFLYGGSGRIRLGILLLWIFCPIVAGVGPTVFTWTSLFAAGIATWMRRTGLVGRAPYYVLLVLALAVHGMVVGWSGSFVGLATALCIDRDLPHSSKPWIFVGTVSYSLYLFHPLVGGRLMNLASRSDVAMTLYPLTVAAAVGLSVAVAWVFWRLVEKPSHAWAHRYFRGGQHAPAQPS